MCVCVCACVHVARGPILSHCPCPPDAHPRCHRETEWEWRRSKCWWCQRSQLLIYSHVELKPKKCYCQILITMSLIGNLQTIFSTLGAMCDPTHTRPYPVLTQLRRPSRPSPLPDSTVYPSALHAPVGWVSALLLRAEALFRADRRGAENNNSDQVGLHKNFFSPQLLLDFQFLQRRLRSNHADT